MKPENGSSAPTLAVIVLKFAECCRLIAAIYLLLFSVGALNWLAAHSSYVIQQEVTALSELKNFGTSTTEQNSSRNAQVANRSGANGELATNRLVFRTALDLPIISGILSVSVPPAAWLVICVFITILLVIFIVSIWQQVIISWTQALACSWTSFLSILGCIWNWIWVIIATLVTLVITILGILYVVYNIVAFIAAVA